MRRQRPRLLDPPVAGVQWEKGAVGTARWTGVRMAELLRMARIAPSARYVWLDGADLWIGRAPDFIRSLPIDKAIHPDTLLAYAMNDQPLPMPHGFPLRAIVPGWEGAYSVKWLTHLQVSRAITMAGSCRPRIAIRAARCARARRWRLPKCSRCRECS